MTQFNHVEISCEADLIGREERIAAHRARVERTEGCGPRDWRSRRAEERRRWRELQAESLAAKRAVLTAQRVEAYRRRLAAGNRRGFPVPAVRLEDGYRFPSVRSAALAGAPHLTAAQSTWQLLRAITSEEPFVDGFHYDTVPPARKCGRRIGHARAVERVGDGQTFDSQRQAIEACGLPYNAMHRARFRRAMDAGEPYAGHHFRLLITSGQQHGGGNGQRQRQQRCDGDGAGDRAEPGDHLAAPGLRRHDPGVPDRDVEVAALDHV